MQEQDNQHQQPSDTQMQQSDALPHADSPQISGRNHNESHNQMGQRQANQQLSQQDHQQPGQQLGQQSGSVKGSDSGQSSQQGYQIEREDGMNQQQQSHADLDATV